ncbi:MAG TPA: hypothetical protein GX010_05095 [Erysipelotrichaceae bacterium]|nr:hypothetical protein [Erysipelotrichaceae bacterium]
MAIPISISSFSFACPPQFDETYYGELPHMFKRLKKGEEGKIVLIGNSALAFGIHSEMISQELNREVVSFGLYGAIGTKAMIDLSRVGIKKGDIIVLAPEISEQALSLYFSSKEMWRAIESNYEMFSYIDKKSRKNMIGNYAPFVAEKFSYFSSGSKPKVEGVYTQNSFNIEGQEVGYMTYDRPYNIMLGGYDTNSMIDFDVNYLKDDFIDYINKFNRFVTNKKAKLYYGFVPMNRLSISSSRDEITTFYSTLNDKIDFPILGNPFKYFFNYEWFYDNNNHLNSSGVNIYNRQIVNDLKIVLEDSSETNIIIPDEPTIPIAPFEEGNNIDEDLFNYEERYYNDVLIGYKIVSLDELPLDKKSVIVPSTHNGLPVVAFSKKTFSNNEQIVEIVIPKNIRGLFNHSFVRCKKLLRIVLQHDDPNSINVGTALLEGARNCKIYVKKECYDNFANHYNWSYYRDKLRKY